MKSKIYIETSIIGYLISRPTRDLITVANQQLTREWWEKEREKYDLFVSTVVIDEIGGGDRTAAQERINVVNDCKTLSFRDEATALGQEIIKKHSFLKKPPLMQFILHSRLYMKWIIYSLGTANISQTQRHEIK